MPVILQFVAKDRFVRSRAKPQVVFDCLVDWQRFCSFADWTAHADPVDASGQQFADPLCLMEKSFDLRLHRIGSLLRPHLTDPIVLSCRFNCLFAFPLAVRKRLFNVDIFAGLHRPDCSQAVPMIARCHDDGIDHIIVDQFSKIAERLCRREASLRLAKPRCIRVAQADNIDAFDRRKCAHQLVGTSTAADESKPHGIICHRSFGNGRKTESDTSSSRRCHK